MSEPFQNPASEPLHQGLTQVTYPALRDTVANLNRQGMRVVSLACDGPMVWVLYERAAT